MKLGLQNGDAGRFRSDQCLCDVEPALGQQVVQVIARDAARNLRVARPDQICVFIAQLFERRVNLAAPAAGCDDLLQFVVCRRPDPHLQPVVGQDLEAVGVVRHAAARPVELRHDRVDAAGVVAEHAAERAAVVGGGIGTEGQTDARRLSAKGVQHDAGLDTRDAGLRIDVEHRVDVLRHVHDDGDVAALAREAGAPAARQDRCAMPAAHVDRRHHVVAALWYDDADGDLAVVGGVGRVERAAAGVEADFAADGAAKICGKVGHDLRYENTQNTRYILSCLGMLGSSGSKAKHGERHANQEAAREHGSKNIPQSVRGRQPRLGLLRRRRFRASTVAQGSSSRSVADDRPQRRSRARRAWRAYEAEDRVCDA
jgi:hypothetical protein